jgi:geranylgeranyl pyrophosphate synthase/predicted secreted hydrolase
MLLSALIPFSHEDSDVSPTPRDWPGPGLIDLAIHDCPHASSTLEWWYLNCHLSTVDGREISVFAAFFRQASGVDPVTKTLVYAHSVTFAFSEPSRGRYAAKVAVDAHAPALGLAKLMRSASLRDAPSTRALRELLAQGKVPLPTRMLDTEAEVDLRSLDLRLGEDSLQKLASGAYRLRLFDETTGNACTLVFEPEKAPVRFAADGEVHGVADERMFYYYIPRCRVHGELTLGAGPALVASGSGWYDHEFGFSPSLAESSPNLEVEGAEATSWRWVSLQLGAGVDVSVYIITRGAEVLDNWTVISAADGGRRVFQGARLTPLEKWRSTRSFVEYPVAWRLEVPAAGLDLHVRAAFPDQEVLTIISDPGFWEGRVDAAGVVDGAPTGGKGWVECKGFRFADIESFFGAVSKEVRARLDELLPLDPKPKQLASWLVRSDCPSQELRSALAGIRPDLLTDALAKPIRDITDRGGKAWRSYAALACIDVVGGDSRRFLHWLAIPELLHVGSLIVDDVEDQSIIRRGGPTCHVLHGQPRAINAGTAAYFLSEPPVHNDDIPAESKLAIYRFYFDALRAGHAGQALDLADIGALVRAAVASGHLQPLEDHVLAVHRLKTAIPAGMLARIGAVLGGGSPAQVESLGAFFEALGLAFQITDDVLNLRGFEHDLKQRGEDLRHGKLTLPVVRGLARMTAPLRQWLWRILDAKPDDPAVIAQIIDLLEGIGALDHAAAQARELVETAWQSLDPLLEESQFKLIFRSFADFVVARQY